MKINLDKIPIKVDDNKIQELYNGDYKKALEDVSKNERYLAVENISLKNKLDKYKEVINKIKYNIEINVISMKNGKLLIELDVNEINDLLEEIE